MDLKVRLRNAGSAEMISILDELVKLGQHASKVQDELIDKIEEDIYMEPARNLVEIAAKTRSEKLLEAIQTSYKIKLNASDHAILLEAGFGQFEKELTNRLEQQIDADPAGGWNWRAILNSLFIAGTQQSKDTLEWFEDRLGDRIDSLKYKAANTPDTPSNNDEFFDRKYLEIYEEMLELTRQARVAASQRPSHLEKPTGPKAGSTGTDHSYESRLGDKLDKAIESVELKLRALIADVLEEHKEQVPQHVMDKVQPNLVKKLKRDALTKPDRFDKLSERLKLFDLRHLEATITSKQLWKLFEPIFKNKEGLANRFSQIANARNANRHSYEEHDVIYMDAKAGVAWFSAVLDD